MLKARNREQRSGLPPHLAGRPAPAQPASQPAQPRAPTLVKPEPDYEVVEFPTEQQQYVNAKLQPPPPPPPRPQTGHPVESSCGLCGGGGARVRCAECGRRALCASCDDMYHRHPKRRNHQRQALSPLQLRDERPPLPPKVTPPVPPPRRHKLSGDRASASPRPQQMVFEQRRGTTPGQLPPHLARLAAPPAATAPVAAVAHVTHAAHVAHAGHGAPVAAPAPPYMHSHTLGHLTPAWAPHRGSLTGFNVQPHMINMQSHAEPWESPESVSPTGQWARPLRRGASVLELGAAGAACPGCAQCAGPAAAWRYGSCASLERAWPAWPGPACCPPAPHQLHQPHHPHMHVPHTPHAYRRADSRAVSRAASRAGSRAGSPAMSVRSRASRRTRHRTPSPPPLPSSDADSESESDSDHDRPPPRLPERREEKTRLERRDSTDSRSRRNDDKRENLRKYERDRQEKVEREDRERRESLKIREERERRDGRERREQRIRKEETERREESERRESKRVIEDDQQQELDEDLANDESESLGPAPPPPSTEWQCEHCTFVNEPGVRVCVVCCRTPTAAPTAPAAPATPAVRTSPAAPARTSHAEPTAAFEQLSLNNRTSASPARTYYVETPAKQNGEEMNHRPVKERASTACGPSPPREELFRKPTSRLVTPTREPVRTRHDMGVGPSPPKEIKHSQTESNAGVRASPYREPNRSSPRATVTKHSVSIGPSPPRDSTLRPSMSNIPKKSDGTSPPHERILESRSSSSSVRANVSNTGTSPPPQSISTQTYEVPNWERAPSVSRSRARHRFRDDGRRERSHSRHSLSSDTRSTGGGRWEWRSGRESSPGGEWSGSERRGRPLARRASHLDLRRARPAQPQPVLRRSSFYGSEAVSPEPLASSRTLSLEALALGAPGRREAERGLELARLMVDAERLGFSAAEVHAALAQNPAAPLSWLRERWPSLVAGVRAAAARLAPGVAVPELEARAALARHRGAMWPAVTDCVDRHRRQVEAPGAGSERGVRGRVWGSPAGADNDAAPPRRERRAREDSSDEFEAPTSSAFRDDDWMYLPLDSGDKNPPFEVGPGPDIWNNDIPTANVNREDIAQKLKTFLIQAGVPSINEDLLLKGLLADSNFYKNDNAMNIETLTRDNALQEKVQPNDLVQTEMDFINAYNALTRLSPLPNISNQHNTTKNGAINKIPKRNKNTDNNENKAISNPKLLTDNQSIIEKESNLEVTGIIQQDSEYENESINEKQIDLATKSQNTNKETVTDAKNVTIVNKNKPAASTKEIRHVTKIKNGRIKEAHSARNREYPSDNNSKSKTNNVSINEQEKANNLSEIVDNTQRLIQQMKEEINSDINSLDGGMSQSEADNSSNDDLSTEHESSYSDSEKETDNLTSDDNETSSSSSNEEENARSEKSGTIINRTSSEDNDQFEEAMDHIEEKNDSFKQTNMELLDSIARSLQQEQTIEIEINPIKETTARPKLAATKIQDLNNNLYNVVNSFEEIYDEMNERPIDHTDNEKNTIIIEQNNENILNIGNISETTQESVAKYEILDKQNVQITTLPLPFIEPINLIITENLHTILNATIQNEEYSETFENIVAVQGTERLENETQVSKENHVDHITTNSVTTSDLIIDNENEHSNSSLFTPGETEYIDGGDNNDIHSENPRNSVSPIENLIEQSGANENVEHGLIFDNKIQNDNTARMNSVSPEKLVPTSPNGNSKVTNKSNIPKLIRITPNNKQKNDKSSPKVISSKVPVRRGSLKQYPAPTPPKMQFGNVQNGHVKQLQTRLFNNKLPKINTNALVTKLKNESLSPIDVRPSTSSTLSKKRPAPQPPTQTQEVAKQSPEKTLAPPKEKNYFRETCRTEDEWTESDSDDSQPYVGKKQSEDEPQKPPSPPPPITLRRVSGQLIDLARIRLLEGSPERQARMLLAEGALENWEQAQLAVELVSRGTEPPAALLAALECTDLNSALAYLHQDCELCAAPFPEHEMVSMLRCTHRCCRECARHYFTVQVTERSIVDCVCPFCKEPELENLNDDEWLEYFAHLDIQLKTLIDTDVHELFQRKLRDRTLARDPNFRWCVECSSGFFVHPKQKKLRCPECRSVSCATCRKPWAASHEGLTCEKYAEWLEDNDPERSISAVQQHLKENGLECPRCRFKYSLSRGGCMHFTCTQCKFEFCYGCGKPFMMGARCGLNEYCARLGLHAHHPRNCLFYLRDKEPHELQTLLQMNNVSYETEPPEGSGGRCPVQLQRETPAGLVDAACGGDVPPNHAGMCQPHYVEYLAAKARALDPIPIMDVAELVAELRRRALPLPERGPWDTDPIYAGMCAEIVREKIPLD